MIGIEYHSFLVITCLIQLAQSSGRKEYLDPDEIENLKQQGVNVDDVSPDTIFITPPKLNDEEQGSKFMPEAYRCEGCHVIAYQLQKHFAAAEEKKKGAQLSYVETLEVVEERCNDEFKNYGLKSFQGQKMLSGEGLPGEKISGMVDTGGVWTSRLRNICKELVGQFDEDGIYELYQAKDGDFKRKLCVSFCKRGEPKLEL